jgi:hypothetical protein
MVFTIFACLDLGFLLERVVLNPGLDFIVLAILYITTRKLINSWRHLVQIKSRKKMSDKDSALTLHLYLKHDVLASLMCAILEKDVRMAVFWALELAYSGWGREACNFMRAIYEECFDAAYAQPRLGKFLDKMGCEGTQNVERVASMAANLAQKSRKCSVAQFVNISRPQIEGVAESKIFIVLETADLPKYYPVEFLDKIPMNRAYFRDLQIPSSRKDLREFMGYLWEDEEERSREHRDHWLYYASFCPVWAERIAKHGGVLHTETLEITSPDEKEGEDKFRENYDVELDEQSLAIQERHILDATKIVQKTRQDFIREFGQDLELEEPKKVVIRVKKRSP